MQFSTVRLAIRPAIAAALAVGPLAIATIATAPAAFAADNQAPYAGEIEWTDQQDSDVIIRLSGIDPDGDPVTFSVASQPEHGVLSDLYTGQVTWAETPITYTPQSGWSGTDSFTYRVTDAHGASDTATVSLNLLPTNPSCMGRQATIVVGGPNQTTWGTNNADVIIGTSGSDLIYGLGGNDVICAGTGNDTIYGGSGNDSIQTGSGNDSAYGGTGNDILDAGTGVDLLAGENGNDRLTADQWSDRVWGGTGSDAFNVAGGHWVG